MSFYIFNTLAIILTLLIAYYKWCYQHWKKKGIPYIEPRIPFGICTAPFFAKENWAVTMARYYKEMKKRGWKHGGIYVFASPSYFPLNLDYLKNIFTKDFQYFTDRALYYHEKKDVLNAHLVNMAEPKWKLLRPKLTPTFSSSKTRVMFQTLTDCQNNLLNKMNEKCGEPVDIKDVSLSFTTDVVGSCFFGLDCKSFESEDSPFKLFTRKVCNPPLPFHLKRVFGMTFPKLATFLNFCINPQEITDFFLKIVKDTVAYRQRNKVIRNDFLQLLIELKNREDGIEPLTITEVAAQCFGMFNAGFETSSALMTFALYELARNPRIQDEIRKEIEAVVKKHSEMTYDCVQEMTYLNQVIHETLRMYPPIHLLNRRCVKNYKIPDEDIIIEKGTMVMLPILGLHYDEEYFPQPEKFDPDRFSEENRSSIPKYAYLPFGEGPRICIGKHFGFIQAKVGLSCLLKHFKFAVNPKTEEPLQIQATGHNISAASKIWLDVLKI